MTNEYTWERVKDKSERADRLKVSEGTLELAVGMVAPVDDYEGHYVLLKLTSPTGQKIASATYYPALSMFHSDSELLNNPAQLLLFSDEIRNGVNLPKKSRQYGLDLLDFIAQQPQETPIPVD